MRVVTRIVIAILAALSVGPAFIWSQNSVWQKLGSPSSPAPSLNAAYFFDRDTGFTCGGVSAGGRLYATVTAGTSWSSVSLPGSPALLNDITFAPGSGSGIVVGNSGYVATTTNRGTSWTLRSSSLAPAWPGGTDINGACMTAPGVAFVVGDAPSGGTPRFARTTDGGASWQNIPLTTPSNNLYDLDFFDSQRGIAIGTGKPPRASRTTDGGVTWTTRDSLGASGTVSLSFYGIDIAPGTGIAYAAGGKVISPGAFYPEVRKSSDSGISWVTTGLSAATGYTSVANDILALNDQVVFASARDGKLYVTTDGGATWYTELLPSNVGSYDLRKFAILPDKRCYLVGYGGTVLRYEALPVASFSLDTFKTSACPGSSQTQTLTISNTGTGVLLLDSVRYRVSAGSPLSYVTLVSPGGINGGASGILSFRITATANAAPGVYADTLKVYSNDGNYTGINAKKFIPIIVTVLPKGLVVNASTPLDAGGIRPGFTKVTTYTNVIRNPNTCPVTISSITFARGSKSEFSLQAPISTTLNSGQTLSVPIYFDPLGICTRLDTMIVNHDGAGSPLRIPVTGTGLEPGFATIPADTLDFGNVSLSATSSADLTIKDLKPGSCLDSTKIFSFKILPDQTDFSTGFSIPVPVYVQPTGAIVVSITAHPSATGIRVAHAAITHEVLGGSATDTVVLIVNGVKPSLSSLRNDIAFALTDVGGRRDSTVKSFLQNSSGVDVQINAVAINGANKTDFVYNGPQSFLVADSKSAGLDVSFTPSAKGLRQASMVITTNIPSTITIQLSGSGDRPQIGTRRDQIVFQPTAVNDTTDTAVSRFIYNNGMVMLRVRNSHIGGIVGATNDDSLAFSLVSPVIPPDSLLVKPADSAGITVSFHPKHPGAHYARLFLYNNSDSTPVVINLIGSAQAAQITTSDSVVFPVTRVLALHDTVVTRLIRNPIGGRLDIASLSISGPDRTSFAVTGPATPLSIGDHGDTSIAISFHPLRRGRHLANLDITSSQGSFSVVLIGQAVYPFLEVSPDNATNLRVRIRTTKRLQINITNQGDDSARIENAVIVGSGAFSNASTGSFPVRLLPGQSIPIFVDFTPDSYCDHLAAVQLRGEGIQGIYAIADTTVTIVGIGTGAVVESRAPEISFGTHLLGSQNDSTLPDFLGGIDFSGAIESTCIDGTAVDSIRITGPGASSYSILSPLLPPAVQLQAGEYMPFQLRFQPALSGLQAAEMLVYFDGSSDSVHRIKLFGAGSLLPIRYGPAPNMLSMDFEKVHIGMHRDSTFTATNISATPFQIDELATSRPDEFSIVSPVPPFAMEPGKPVSIIVRFAPRDTLGVRNTVVRLRSLELTDSGFGLAGTGVRSALRGEGDTIDFGRHAPGSVTDTNGVLVNFVTTSIPSLSLLGSSNIESGAIVAGTESFEAGQPPRFIDAGGTDSMSVRFRPVGLGGERHGILRLWYDKQDAGLLDSVDIFLKGLVDGPTGGIQVDLGPDLIGKPGEIIAYPLTLVGEVDSLKLQKLDLFVRYRTTMLRPKGVESATPGVSATFDQPALAGLTSTVPIHLSTNGQLGKGAVATLRFEVLLGDSLSTLVRLDSTATPGRSGLSVTGDTARFSIDGFCDAAGRLIGFNGQLKLAISPNPSSGATVIVYEIPAITDVHLAIYNSSGQELATIADGIFQPGIYTAQIDARALGQGVHYCLLKAGRFIRTLTVEVVK